MAVVPLPRVLLRTRAGVDDAGPWRILWIHHRPWKTLAALRVSHIDDTLDYESVIDQGRGTVGGEGVGRNHHGTGREPLGGDPQTP